jgi:hypothetical protein
MKRTILAMCIAMSLTGCAQLEALRSRNAPAAPASFVAELNEADSERIGKDMATFLADQFPAAKTTVYVEPSNTIVRALLVDDLAAKGFGILETKPDQGPAVALQYFITNLRNGILVRMRYGDAVASRYYGRQTDGSLYAAGKIAVREAAK